MTILQELSAKGLHISNERHVALQRVVLAVSESELQEAHAQVLSELKKNNIWVAMTESGILLCRQWPESPGIALVSFPDQGTAFQVLKDIGATTGSNTYKTGIIAYSDAIQTANANKALLVMVTYDEVTPHYVPISHLGVQSS